MAALQEPPRGAVRARFAHEARKLRTTYNAALWAMEQRLKKSNPAVSEKIRTLRREIEAEFGTSTRLLRMILGPGVDFTT